MVAWSSNIVQTRRLSHDDAAKAAGRLSVAVTAASNRVGRAFVKPFYAQANDILVGWRCSSLLMNATLWRIAFLGQRIKSSHSTTVCRPRWICWTDASGALRLIAAVITSARGAFFVRASVPDWFWCQQLPREGQPNRRARGTCCLVLSASFDIASWCARDSSSRRASLRTC